MPIELLEDIHREVLGFIDGVLTLIKRLNWKWLSNQNSIRVQKISSQKWHDNRWDSMTQRDTEKLSLSSSG